MANLVRFIRKGGRIIPIRAPLGGNNLQAAPHELSARAHSFAKKAGTFVQKYNKLSRDADKLAAVPGGKYLHVSAQVNERAEHSLKRAASALKISQTLETYKKATAASAHIARNKGKYALGATASTLVAKHEYDQKNRKRWY